MNATLETAQLKLRADMLRMLRRDREELISELCDLFDCSEDKLFEEAKAMKEDKVETLQKEREKELDNLKKENAQFAGELNTRKEDNDKIVADLREQIRVLKKVMEEEETLI